MSTPHVLVVGAGSAGQRHARNLAQLGCRISAVDPREDRLAEISREVAVDTGHRHLPEALCNIDVGAVVIASPTAFHVDQALAALDADLPVLLEKPVATDAASAQRLQAAVSTSEAPLLLVYTWRWWPALRHVRALVEDGTVGEIRHVRCTMSAHLADWHPWEPYQEFFMSSRELGGGALLDESHWIDLALWLFGMPQSVFATIDRLSDLEIDADDNVDLLLDYGPIPRVWLHLDLHGRPHERSLTISGANGTIAWSAADNAVRVGRGEADWAEEQFPGERNDMFVGVAEEFLEVIRGDRRPSCTVEDGLAVMEVIDAARHSATTRATTEVPLR